MVVLIKLTTKPLSKNLAFDPWTSTYLCGQKPCLKVRDYLKLNEHVSNILSKFHLVVKWSTNIHYSHMISILYEVLYAFYNIFHILHGYWFARFGLSIWKYHLILLINMPIKKPPPVGSNLVSCTLAYTAWPKYCHHTCKTEIVKPLRAQSNGELHSQRHGSINASKFGTFPIMFGMTGRLSNFMYNFIKNGIVGKSSSCNFMLHRPKDASNIIMCVTHQ